MKLLVGIILGLALGLVLLVGGTAKAQQVRPAVLTDTNCTRSPGEARVALLHSTNPRFDFEICQFQFGPMMHVKEGVVQFLIGDAEAGNSELSVMSYDASRGAQLGVRDAGDTMGLYLEWFGRYPRLVTKFGGGFGSPQPIAIDPSNGRILLGAGLSPGLPLAAIDTPIFHANAVSLGMNQGNEDPTKGQIWAQWDVSSGQRVLLIMQRPPGDTGTAGILAEFDGATGQVRLRTSAGLKTVQVGDAGSCGTGFRCLRVQD